MSYEFYFIGIDVRNVLTWYWGKFIQPMSSKTFNETVKSIILTLED